jgi:2-polyprenyl-3-methyl-5-hydroxy-6-metoxy-1,4-benzoquinol methylase
MSDQTQDPDYLLAEVGDEVVRLQKQHAWIMRCLKDQIVFAPLDLKKEGLKVLDVGCADGT